MMGLKIDTEKIIILFSIFFFFLFCFISSP